MVENVKLDIDFGSGSGKSPIEIDNLSTEKVNATVQDVMNVASCSNDLRYTASYDSKYANFLETVNCFPDTVNTTKAYWSLYINGNYTNCGMSTCILNTGDVVAWKYVPGTSGAMSETFDDNVGF